MSCARFAPMIAASTVAMVRLMDLNTSAQAHVPPSVTRMWMALLWRS